MPPKGEEAVRTAGDLTAYSIRQNEALEVCDAKRSALVDLIVETNKALKKRRWGF